MQEFLTNVEDVKYLTMDVAELAVNLVIPSSISFEAGQYMQFKMSDSARPFYIAVPPDGNRRLKFCIGLKGDGMVAQFVRGLRTGDQIVMQGPAGSLTFRDFSRNAFFVASGLGVIPFASLAPDMLARGYRGKIHLLFGLEDEDSVFYFDRFGQLASLYPNFKFTPLLASPKSHWPGEVGRLTTYLDIHDSYHRGDLIYLCGDPEVVRRCRELLLSKGHKPEDIKTEVFAKRDALAAAA